MANPLLFEFVPEQHDGQFSELYTTLYSPDCVALALLPCLLSRLCFSVSSPSQYGSLIKKLVAWNLVSALCMCTLLGQCVNVDTATLHTILQCHLTCIF